MNHGNILFVCTGNICRSPMAEAMFKDMILKFPELSSAGVTVKSAGILDLDHHKASEEAVQIMQERGLDMTEHRSRQIDQDLIDWSDIILVMENEHRENISDQFPHVQKKVLMLSEFAGEKGDVSDPIDKEIETYRQCARILTHLVQVAAEKMVKGAKNE